MFTESVNLWLKRVHSINRLKDTITSYKYINKDLHKI